MPKIAVYQVRDDGAKVKITFEAVEKENIFLSSVSNVPKSIVGKIQHWNSHSELVKIEEDADDPILENLFEERKKERNA